jgi:hypothetical protein
MVINRVTMTGPDDSVDPSDLLSLSERYPFVEWGILVSKKAAGRNRFPTLEWLDSLLDVWLMSRHEMDLSCHVCGRWVNDILLGQGTVFEEMKRYMPMFNRVQINTHGELLPKDRVEFSNLLQKHAGKQFIIQWEGVNGEELLYGAKFRGLNVVPLFDMSHGAGVAPDSWPQRLVNPANNENEENVPFYCGYAGGLGPSNLEKELKRIELATAEDMRPNYPIWIDMETHIRSNNDLTFDLEKVEECLKIAKKYVPSVYAEHFS